MTEQLSSGTVPPQNHASRVSFFPRPGWLQLPVRYAANIFWQQVVVSLRADASVDDLLAVFPELMRGPVAAYRVLDPMTGQAWTRYRRWVTDWSTIRDPFASLAPVLLVPTFAVIW